MKKIISTIIAFCTISAAFSAEIYSHKSSADTFIKVVQLSTNSYRFASCTTYNNPAQCTWLGKQASYTNSEVATIIKRIKRDKISRSATNTFIIGGTAVGSVALGLGSIIVSALGGGIAGTGAFVVCSILGLNTSSILLTQKGKHFSKAYPRELARALDEIVNKNEQKVIVEIKKMNYLAKLLEDLLDYTAFEKAVDIITILP